MIKATQTSTNGQVFPWFDTINALFSVYDFLDANAIPGVDFPYTNATRSKVS